MPNANWNGYSYLSVDPGINNTGWALHEISLTGVPKLINWGCISPPDLIEKTEDRIYAICWDVARMVNNFKVGFVLIEVPPSTIYGQKKTNAGGLIARAQDVFKTVAVAYSISTAVKILPTVKVECILPSQWQASPKERKRIATKAWSRFEANKILMHECGKGPNHFTTDKHENIADAIVLGRRCFLKDRLP